MHVHKGDRLTCIWQVHCACACSSSCYCSRQYTVVEHPLHWGAPLDGLRLPSTSRWYVLGKGWGKLLSCGIPNIRQVHQDIPSSLPRFSSILDWEGGLRFLEMEILTPSTRPWLARPPDAVGVEAILSFASLFQVPASYEFLHEDSRVYAYKWWFVCFHR